MGNVKYEAGKKKEEILHHWNDGITQRIQCMEAIPNCIKKGGEYITI